MRLIDADNVRGLFDAEFKETRKLILAGETHLDNLAEGFTEAGRVIRAMPTVDAEVVVRCKDCKHSTPPSKLTQRYGVPGTLTCHNRYSPCNRRNVGGDDFCSYGERKDGTDG